MNNQLTYIMRDQTRHKVQEIMTDPVTANNKGYKGFLFPSLLLATLVLVQILLSASTAITD